MTLDAVEVSGALKIIASRVTLGKGRTGVVIRKRASEHT